MRWVFLLVALLGLVSTLPGMVGRGPRGWLAWGLAAAVALTFLWARGYRHGFPLWDDAVEWGCLVAVGLACREPASVMSVLYVMLMYRSLWGTHRGAAARTAAYGGAMELLVVVHPVSDPMMSPGAVATWFLPSILLTAFSMRALAVVLARHQAAGDRAHALATAGGALLAARTEAAVGRQLAELASRLVAVEPLRCEVVVADLPPGAECSAGGGEGEPPPRAPTQLGRSAAPTRIELPIGREAEGRCTSLVVEVGRPVERSVEESLQMAVRQAALALDNVRLQGELAHRASHDILTGLPNRAFFLEELQDKWERMGDQGQVAVLFIDLDDFKTVNDAMGHATGDVLLQAVAERLQGLRRGGDLVARIGGDEFAVLAWGVTGEDGAEAIGRRIVTAFEEPFDLAGRSVNARCSVGITLSGAATAPEDMVRYADLAMYVAKALGKSRYQVFSPTMQGVVASDLESRLALERALREDQLVLHYQPVVALGTGELRGFEALLRWQHPERGLVAPLDFLPAAERLGVIVDVERWVLLEACRQAAKWPQGSADHPLRVAVNLSAAHVQHPELVAHVRKALASARLAPQRLAVEVTEGAVIGDAPAAAEHLRQLAELGVAVALDDFGTGYSSLSHLDRLPVDTIKVDRSFVVDTRRPIVAAILDMARALGMRVIAEGVETAEQAAWLQDAGCLLAQGYYYARPVPAEGLARWLAGVAGRPPELQEIL